MIRILFLYTILILFSSCSIGGRNETYVENLSSTDTLIVELYKAELNPKFFEIWKEKVSDEPEIYCQRLWIDHIRAILYNTVDTTDFKDKNTWKTDSTFDSWSKENQVEIVYFNLKQIKLKFHLLPKNKLTVGVKSFFSNPEAPLNWDTVIVYKSDKSELKIYENVLEENITNKTSERSCGDCGMENFYQIGIK
jgi:hypothetical protein